MTADEMHMMISHLLRGSVTPARPKPDPPNVDSPYLTARQAAAYLNVSYGTFRHWATQIKRARTGRYTREALDTFAATRKKPK